MPRIIVKLYGRFRNFADEAELEIEAQRLSELISILEEKFGNNFQKELLDTNGTLRAFHNILVNGVRIDLFNRFDTELKKDDVVAFFSPIGGGSAKRKCLAGMELFSE